MNLHAGMPVQVDRDIGGEIPQDPKPIRNVQPSAWDSGCLDAGYYLAAMKVPRSVRPDVFGPWTILRRKLQPWHAAICGAKWQTFLHKIEPHTQHRPPGDIVMDDSDMELRRHLPIVMKARGAVLVTGLGLGCVVRGLLANPKVTEIDVIEIDRAIITRIWPEFAPDPRCRVFFGDALKLPISPGSFWDFAWHDIHADDGLQGLHSNLIVRFRDHARRQGAWAFPPEFARLFSIVLPEPLLGAQTRRRRRRAPPHPVDDPKCDVAVSAAPGLRMPGAGAGGLASPGQRSLSPAARPAPAQLISRRI